MGWSLMDCASRTSHAAPVTTVTTRLIQPIHARRRTDKHRNSHAVLGLPKCWLGDEDNKEGNTRDRDRCGEMNGAHVNQRIIHPSPSPLARSRAAHMEGEASFRRVCIDRKRAPVNSVSPWRERFQTDTHSAAADLCLAQIDARALGIGHLHRAECRFEVLREPKRNLMRCATHRAADKGACMIEKGVSVRGTVSKPRK